MSKGFGRIERALLAALGWQSEPIETFTLAAIVYDAKPGEDGRTLVSAAQLASVRRALGKLQRAGKAFDCGRRRHVNRTHWAGERVGIPFLEKWGDLIPSLRTRNSRGRP